jgi:hypothetical protein
MGARRAPLENGLELQKKILGFDALWLWEGDLRGLSFDLRQQIEIGPDVGVTPPASRASERPLKNLTAPSFHRITTGWT